MRGKLDYSDLEIRFLCLLFTFLWMLNLVFLFLFFFSTYTDPNDLIPDIMRDWFSDAWHLPGRKYTYMLRYDYHFKKVGAFYCAKSLWVFAPLDMINFCKGFVICFVISFQFEKHFFSLSLTFALPPSLSPPSLFLFPIIPFYLASAPVLFLYSNRMSLSAFSSLFYVLYSSYSSV